jgi:hypothetical protein
MKLNKKILVLILGVLSYTISSQTRIIYFNAINLTDSVRLNFTISAGSVCAGYQVLKGSDSTFLQPIYASSGGCGNVNFNESHSYTDFSPNRLTPNFYQIHIPPNDYSPIKRIDIAAQFSNIIVFPQPVADQLNIVISDQKNYYYEINIFDRFGRKQGFGSGNAGEKLSLNVSSLDEGVYVFYIVLANGNAYRGKFLKLPNE